MKHRKTVRLGLDFAMTLALIILMSYERIGQSNHEWLGLSLMALSMAHHWANRRWLCAIPKGKYPPLRVFQTVTSALAGVCLSACFISGIVLSQSVFSFLPPHGGYSWARIVHLLGAYWGVLFMGLHLGVHLSRRMLKFPAWIAAGTVFFYGIYAFSKRRVWRILLLKDHFVFFNFSEPSIFYLFDFFTIFLAAAILGSVFCQAIQFAMKQNRLPAPRN